MDVLNSRIIVDAVLNTQLLTPELQFYADFDTDADTGRTTLNAIPVWSFSTLSGSLDDGLLTIDGLRLTQQGKLTFELGLALPEVVSGALLASNAGSLVVAMVPVPEASTLALMGLGLAGIVVVRRRHISNQPLSRG